MLVRHIETREGSFDPALSDYPIDYPKTVIIGLYE